MIINIIVDYLPKNRLKDVSVYDLCEWVKFLVELEQTRGKMSMADIYTFIDNKLIELDEKS